MAKVVLSGTARRALLDLPPLLSNAVLETLTVLEGDPEAGHALRGRLRGLRSLRVGVYRLVCELRRDQTVRVLAVRHRSVAYDRDPR